MWGPAGDASRTIGRSGSRIGRWWLFARRAPWQASGMLAPPPVALGDARPSNRSSNVLPSSAPSSAPPSNPSSNGLPSRTPSPRRADLGARLSPRLETWRAPAGPVRLPSAPEHRLRVHTGAPARGVCGRHVFIYTRGTLDLVPAGASDEWCSDEESDMLVITLPGALLQRAAAELGRSDGGLDSRCLFRDPRLEHIAWALDAERETGAPSGLLYTESLGLALAIHLLSSYSSAGAPSREGRRFSASERRRITHYIEEHLDRSLSLEALADTLGMSSSHFKALFRRSLGVPVHEYVIQRRVERAKALLLEDERPAGEIALAAGFAHQSHMARCMRRVLGVTPSALRRATRA